MFRIFIPGRARTKGSLKPIHQRGAAGRPCRIGLTEDHALSTPWKKTMIRAILKQISGAPVKIESMTVTPLGYEIADAVQVDTFFRFDREESVRGGVGTGGAVPSHQLPWPTANGIGDEDKLRRNVLDALTQSHLLADDALVAGGHNWKRWTVADELSGVVIIVRPAPDAADIRALEHTLWAAAA